MILFVLANIDEILFVFVLTASTITKTDNLLKFWIQNIFELNRNIYAFEMYTEW